MSIPKHSLHTPLPADPADVPSDLTALNDQLGSFLAFDAGTRAARPAVSGMGPTVYHATDQVATYLGWDGQDWQRFGVPAGTTVAMPSAIASIPAGWVLCGGQAVSRTGVYVDLFARIGTTFGTGDGSTTFVLPDLRGRTPVGDDYAAGRVTSNNVIGYSGGAETHTLTTAQMPSHTHTIPGGSTMTFAEGGSGEPQGLLLNTTSTTTATGGGAAHNNMPPYQIVQWIVKL
ncbi:MAG: tail fiber protein [Patulibacter sp.]